MKTFCLFLACLSNVWCLTDGELSFTLGGKQYTTSSARGFIQKKNGKTRVMITVKDTTKKFMLVLTADVATGTEVTPLVLSTVDSELGVSLRTTQGSLAVLPAIQFAKPLDIEYTERVEVATGEMEDEDRHAAGYNGKHAKRPKIRVEYRKKKPRWHTMSKEERKKTGEGIIENSAFQNTAFFIHLQPVVSGGKVVSYQGSFSGSGRFSRSISGAEIKTIQNGLFKVAVDYAP